MWTMRVLLCLALVATYVMCDTSIGKFSSCCTKVSRGKPRDVIENFIIQKEDLPCVHAVIFITNKGNIICSTPGLPWVNSKIKEIRKKNEEGNNQ
ncbi:C-C motif chemokine 24-like [Phyllobates terribilis]|uniref:C-C motif chemokine 24-like n=1 Tax=Phyllobates terribilis TaxID=111132 RepID=UPI003CCB257E